MHEKIFGRLGKGFRVGFTSVLILFLLATAVNADFMSTVREWIGDLIGKILSWLLSKIVYWVGMMLDYVYWLLVNPHINQPRVVDPPWIQVAGMMMDVIVMIVFFLIMHSAIMLIFTTLTPSERANAKTQLQKMIIALILIPVSPQLYQILIDLNQQINTQLLGGAYVDDNGIYVAVTQYTYCEILPPCASPATGNGVPQFRDIIVKAFNTRTAGSRYIFIFCCAFIVALLAISIIYLRYICVIILACMMPFTILFYMFDFTKTVGRKFLKYSIAWAFAPVVMAVWVIIAAVMLHSLGTATTGASHSGPDPDVSLSMAIAFLAMICASPLIITGALEAVGAIVASAGQMQKGMGGAAMTAAGQILKAKSPEGMLTAGLMVASQGALKMAPKVGAAARAAPAKMAQAGGATKKVGAAAFHGGAMAVSAGMGLAAVNKVAKGVKKVGQGVAYVDKKAGKVASRSIKGAAKATAWTATKGFQGAAWTANMAATPVAWSANKASQAAGWAGKKYRGAVSIGGKLKNKVKGAGAFVGKKAGDAIKAMPIAKRGGMTVGDVMKKQGVRAAWIQTKRQGLKLKRGAKVMGQELRARGGASLGAAKAYLGQVTDMFGEGDGEGSGKAGKAAGGATAGLRGSKTGFGATWMSKGILRAGGSSIGAKIGKTKIGKGIANWSKGYAAKGGHLGALDRKVFRGSLSRGGKRMRAMGIGIKRAGLKTGRMLGAGRAGLYNFIGSRGANAIDKKTGKKKGTWGERYSKMMENTVKDMDKSPVAKAFKDHMGGVAQMGAGKALGNWARVGATLGAIGLVGALAAAPVAGAPVMAGAMVPGAIGLGANIYMANKLGQATGTNKMAAAGLRGTKSGRGFALGFNKQGMEGSVQAFKGLSGAEKAGFIAGKMAGMGTSLAIAGTIGAASVGMEKGVGFATTGGMSLVADGLKAPFQAGGGLIRGSKAMVRTSKALKDMKTGPSKLGGTSSVSSTLAGKASAMGSVEDLANGGQGTVLRELSDKEAMGKAKQKHNSSDAVKNGSSPDFDSLSASDQLTKAQTEKDAPVIEARKRAKTKHDSSEDVKSGKAAKFDDLSFDDRLDKTTAELYTRGDQKADAKASHESEHGKGSWAKLSPSEQAEKTSAMGASADTRVMNAATEQMRTEGPAGGNKFWTSTNEGNKLSNELNIDQGDGAKLAAQGVTSVGLSSMSQDQIKSTMDGAGIAKDKYDASQISTNANRAVDMSVSGKGYMGAEAYKNSKASEIPTTDETKQTTDASGMGSSGAPAGGGIDAAMGIETKDQAKKRKASSGENEFAWDKVKEGMMFGGQRRPEKGIGQQVEEMLDDKDESAGGLLK